MSFVAIPDIIADEETIARTVFSPFHIDHKKNTLKNNAFRAPYGSNEISVDRLDYTSFDECRNKAKSMESGDKSFHGIAISLASSIREVEDVDVDASPIDNNMCHANILYDFVLNKGIEALPEQSYKIKEVTKKFRLINKAELSDL